MSIDIFFCSMCNSEIASTHTHPHRFIRKFLRKFFRKQHPHLCSISEWISIYCTMNLLHLFEFITPYLLFFVTPGSELLVIFFALFWYFQRSPIYLAIIRKLNLNENKIHCCQGGMDIEQEIWKSSVFWRSEYRISISCISFWKFKCVFPKKLGVSKKFLK